jgi:hypothetical protein
MERRRQIKTFNWIKTLALTNEKQKETTIRKSKEKETNFFQPRRNDTKLNDLDRLVETKTVKKD